MIYTEHGRELKSIEFHGDPELGFDSVAFTVFSAILATVALMTDSVPVLIGAMIVAPQFDSLIAVPFGLLTRNWKLALQGMTTSFILFTVAFGVCVGMAWLLLNYPLIPPHPDLLRREIISERLLVGWHSVITALAAGAAGAIAFAANRQTSVVGVVVALALVPALAASAIRLQEPLPAGLGGLGLFGVNVVGIIVAGLATLAIRYSFGKAHEEIENHKHEESS